MVKLDTDAAGTLTGDERDALALYGSDRPAARLAKALEPPTPSAPVPAPVRAPARRPVTRRDLRVAIDAYSDAMTKILREQRDSITALQQRSSDAERTYAELTAKVQQLCAR